MATQDEKLAAVAAAVERYADVETALEADKLRINSLIQAIEECYILGIGRQGEFVAIKNRLEAAHGLISDAIDKVICAHRECTTIAKREGCDVVLPANFAIDGGVPARDGGR